MLEGFLIDCWRGFLNCFRFAFMNVCDSLKEALQHSRLNQPFHDESWQVSISFARTGVLRLRLTCTKRLVCWTCDCPCCCLYGLIADVVYLCICYRVCPTGEQVSVQSHDYFRLQSSENRSFGRELVPKPTVSDEPAVKIVSNLFFSFQLKIASRLKYRRAHVHQCLTAIAWSPRRKVTSDTGPRRYKKLWHNWWTLRRDETTRSRTPWELSFTDLTRSEWLMLYLRKMSLSGSLVLYLSLSNSKHRFSQLLKEKIYEWGGKSL